MSSISKISPIDESVPSTDSPTSGTKKPPTRTSSVGLKSAPSDLNLTEDAPKSISSRDRKATSTSNLNAKQESPAHRQAAQSEEADRRQAERLDRQAEQCCAVMLCDLGIHNLVLHPHF